MEDLDPIAKFGKFIVENLRDKGISKAELLMKNHWKTPALQVLQAKLDRFSTEEKDVILDAFIDSIDSAIHDFLFALQERAHFEKDFQILVDRENIAEISDGIHGEAFGDDGWYAKFSKYKQLD